jgi:hypothetical protein
MTPSEAFAVIPLAAVSADNRLQPEEAALLNQQLRGHSPYREMTPVAFGTMVSSILVELQKRRRPLIEEAVRLLSLPEPRKLMPSRLGSCMLIASPTTRRSSYCRSWECC